eukprot:jgi/Galph1/1287/GphlegSOOS_G5981.1
MTIGSTEPSQSETFTLVNNDHKASVTLYPAFSLESVSLKLPAGGDILCDISWEVPQESTVVIIGPSGSGKTRLVRLLNRLDDPSRGIIKVFGTDIQQWNPYKLRRKVVYVCQTPYLNQSSVHENLEITVKLGVVQNNSFESALDEALEVVGLRKDLLGHSVNTLSGGEKQRVAIARSLLLCPEVLILDEPTSSLDGLGAQGFLQRLLQWKERHHCTLIVISHRFADLSILGGQLLMLSSGKIVLKGATAEVLESDQGEQVRKLLMSAENNCPDTGAIPLSIGQLGFAAGFIIANAAVIHLLELGLERDIAWGSVRATVQLLAVGYFLRWVFVSRQVLIVMLAFSIMLSVAVWTATRRVKRKLPGLLYKSAVSIVVGSGLTTVVVTAFVIGTNPWWEPRYFLPLAGMIVGNAMNAAALVSERLVSEVVSRQGEIEALLSLAATPRQAVAPALRAALRSSMIPSINGMMTVGLVSLPGMMTGQMLGGADPSVAARYQLMIVFVLAGATSSVAVSLSMLLYRSFFTPSWQLRKDLVASE